MSNFRPVKRVDAVVEIFRRMRGRVNARLLLVGDGPDAHLAQERLISAGLMGEAEFLGEQLDIVALLSVADLFLLPSSQESFGLAALEAMACEVPVIASAVGGLPEVIEHGETGFLYPPEDLQAMADSGVRLLQDRGAACPDCSHRARSGGRTVLHRRGRAPVRGLLPRAACEDGPRGRCRSPEHVHGSRTHVDRESAAALEHLPVGGESHPLGALDAGAARAKHQQRTLGHRTTAAQAHQVERQPHAPVLRDDADFALAIVAGRSDRQPQPRAEQRLVCHEDCVTRAFPAPWPAAPEALHNHSRGRPRGQRNLPRRLRGDRRADRAHG